MTSLLALILFGLLMVVGVLLIAMKIILGENGYKVDWWSSLQSPFDVIADFHTLVHTQRGKYNFRKAAYKDLLWAFYLVLLLIVIVFATMIILGGR